MAEDFDPLLMLASTASEGMGIVLERQREAERNVSLFRLLDSWEDTVRALSPATNLTKL